MYRHYIEINQNNEIVKSYSDGFVQPNENSIFIEENEERHYNLDILIQVNNFTLYTYKYIDNQIVEKTIEELNIEVQAKKDNIDNKIERIKIIRYQLLNQFSWINSLWTAQKYGHDKGINQNDKLISDDLMDQWSLYFEQLCFIEINNDLNTIDYDTIVVTNTNIFPIPPALPGNIV